ncbi:hypothetical protein OED01_10685 [Microbacterium sp. M28]|uniref:hypothetical protein n=1 Tax=Microbacterium sp. M28 TaxID=2962064 RepID=UPI0021F41DA4|nr:hypothetical protein [Microbacterium sp. M28]UYO96070.1 hypothetical protein OED01_10685 [Microbacterium sp. M28]
MTDMDTMVQTEIVIDGTSNLLAQDQDVDDLMGRIEDATATSGRFVTFTVVGNRTMRVLVTPRTQVAISVATVQFDARDTGDTDAPFGGYYDLL